MSDKKDEMVNARLRAGKEPLSSDKWGVIEPGKTIIQMRREEAEGRADDFEIIVDGKETK